MASLKKNPVIKKLIARSYSPFLKAGIKLKTWFNYDRYNEAPLKPFNLIDIDPQIINYYCRRSEIEFINNLLYPQIQDGNWDIENTEEIHKRDRFQAFDQHFNNNIEWGKTNFYQEMVSDIKNGESRYFCNSIEELNKYFQNIDNLYHNIKSKGYLKQSEIEDKSNIVNQNLIIDHFIDEINEVTVNIGRNGKIIFEEGRHRFYIAKLLGLEKIPVRVLIRHKEWQEIRNQAVKNPEKLTKKQKQHPDIKNLINKPVI